MNGEYATLAARIHNALNDLERVVRRAETFGQTARLSNDEAYWDAVALNLHGFYAGTERIFEDIAHTLEGSVPSSPNWHLDLLRQMSSEIKNLRPAVIADDTYRCLDEYRSFRHIVRNVYAFNFRPARLNELVTDLRQCHDAVTRDLKEFAAFLERVAQSDDLLTDTDE
jgi:ribonuclease HepT-like protein